MRHWSFLVIIRYLRRHHHAIYILIPAYVATNLDIRIRLYAAPAIRACNSVLALPLNLLFLIPPTVLSHPKISSIFFLTF